MKLGDFEVGKTIVLSHPSWVRGLKPDDADCSTGIRGVAPFVGAWIETILVRALLSIPDVAPFVGAWIETRP